MIDKKEDSTLSSDAELLSQTCHFLESKVLEVQSEVRTVFARLTEVLKLREKQLLRQIDVAHNQQLAFIQAKAENASFERVPVLKVEMEAEKVVAEAITSLGTISLQGTEFIMLNGDGSFLQSLEDYQDAVEDHMAMFKPVPHDSSASPHSHETVIRFNHISLPHGYMSSTEKHDSPDLSRSQDSSSSELKQHDCCHMEDADLDKMSIVQTSEHPAQVQQWLKQLSAETETEPSVGEPKNFGPL